MRLRHDAQAMNRLLNSSFLISALPYHLNSSMVLEIGMGKGEMLTQLARKNPQTFFVGLEKYPTVAAKAIKQATLWKLKNFHIVLEDARNLIHIFSGQVKVIWLTFSDPWPKKRHAKRRLTSSFFLQQYQKLLAPKGILKIKTDNDDFFAWSKTEIENYGGKIIYQTNNLHQDPKNNFNQQTDYEMKWAQKGKKINYMEVQF